MEGTTASLVLLLQERTPRFLRALAHEPRGIFSWTTALTPALPREREDHSPPAAVRILAGFRQVHGRGKHRQSRCFHTRRCFASMGLTPCPSLIHHQALRFSSNDKLVATATRKLACPFACAILRRSYAPIQRLDSLRLAGVTKGFLTDSISGAKSLAHAIRTVRVPHAIKLCLWQVIVKKFMVLDQFKGSGSRAESNRTHGVISFGTPNLEPVQQPGHTASS